LLLGCWIIGTINLMNGIVMINNWDDWIHNNDK
jgi:hypothetical protein